MSMKLINKKNPYRSIIFHASTSMRGSEIVDGDKATHTAYNVQVFIYRIRMYAKKWTIGGLNLENK